ncbi:MAG: 16S rRNA (uracil(1498)-N(3))-methyltransferase [Clostridium sp.]|nr:16S rRNA (uracil(1498)-N(3))-methyltransferase [Clostridium sp.]
MIQFFAPDIESTLELPAEEASHCVRVLRRRPGDELTVIDGRGHRFLCRLTEATNHRAAVEIISREDIPSPWRGRLVIAVAPTKNLDRIEWLVEKLTEIGIDAFIPLDCERSERRVLKPERLRKIAVSAMKQSLKATLPEIAEMTPIEEVVNNYAGYERYIAYCDREIPRRLFAREYVPNRDTLLMIGPEGDFSPAEIRAALDAGFMPVTLGPSRLRTETAALYGAVVAQAANSAAE